MAGPLKSPSPLLLPLRLTLASTALLPSNLHSEDSSLATDNRLAPRSETVSRLEFLDLHASALGGPTNGPIAFSETVIISHRERLDWRTASLHPPSGLTLANERLYRGSLRDRYVLTCGICRIRDDAYGTRGCDYLVRDRDRSLNCGHIQSPLTRCVRVEWKRVCALEDYTDESSLRVILRVSVVFDVSTLGRVDCVIAASRAIVTRMPLCPALPEDDGTRDDILVYTAWSTWIF